MFSKCPINISFNRLHVKIGKEEEHFSMVTFIIKLRRLRKEEIYPHTHTHTHTLLWLICVVVVRNQHNIVK